VADINLEAVAGKLNRVGYEALFKGLRQAKGAGNRNVELAHWLVHVLQDERTDIVLTADNFRLDRNKLLMDINAAISGFRKNETEMPSVSNTVMDMLDRGWHYATLFFGETQIRTGTFWSARCNRANSTAHSRTSHPNSTRCRSTS